MREGNQAWKAAADQRHQWLKGLLQRKPKKVPRGMMEFITWALLAMPGPMQSLPEQPVSAMFTELTGCQRGNEIDALPDGRLAHLLLGLIAAAFERQIAGDGERRYTWRTDRVNGRCARKDAGRYLGFLAAMGYSPSPIEQAVIDGVPYDPYDGDADAAAVEQVLDPDGADAEGQGGGDAAVEASETS